MNIRQALPTEWQQLQTLNDEVFADNYKYDPDLKRDWAMSPEGERYFKELISDPSQCCFFAEDNGKLVGYIAAAPKEISYRNSKYLEIDNMGVSPEYRGKGVGTMLIEEVKKWAKENGYNKLFVNSYFKNTSTINFYKKNGFNEIDVSLEMEL